MEKELIEEINGIDWNLGLLRGSICDNFEMSDCDCLRLLGKLQIIADMMENISVVVSDYNIR